MKPSRKWVVGCRIPFVILVGLLLFAEWAWGGSIKPSIDPQYVPTAEYLLQHPQSTPSFISVYPEPGSIVQRSQDISVVVVLHANWSDIIQWTRLLLNGERIPGDYIRLTYPYGLHVEKDFNAATFVPTVPETLTSGLHIFRVQVGSSFNDFLNPDPKLSYEWVYRVE